MPNSDLDLINQQISRLQFEVTYLDSDLSNLEYERDNKEAILESPRFNSSNRQQIFQHIKSSVAEFNNKIKNLQQLREHAMQELINLILEKARLRKAENPDQKNKDDNFQNNISDGNDDKNNKSIEELSNLANKIDEIYQDLGIKDSMEGTDKERHLKYLLENCLSKDDCSLAPKDIENLKTLINEEIKNKKNKIFKKHNAKHRSMLFQKNKQQDSENESNKKIAGKFTEAYLQENNSNKDSNQNIKN